MKEICICAAVIDTEGNIWRGHRHCDCLHALRNGHKEYKFELDNQGFITSKNRYVNREEGRKLQDKAGIPSASPEGYMGNTLYSEDLY